MKISECYMFKWPNHKTEGVVVLETLAGGTNPHQEHTCYDWKRHTSIMHGHF